MFFSLLIGVLTPRKQILLLSAFILSYYDRAVTFIVEGRFKGSSGPVTRRRTAGILIRCRASAVTGDGVIGAVAVFGRKKFRHAISLPQGGVDFGEKRITLIDVTMDDGLIDAVK